MAPNGVANRKVPPTFAKPSRPDSGISMENLFDDLKKESKIELLEDVRQKLPVFKTPGSWNSTIIGGITNKDPNTRPPAPIIKLHRGLVKGFSNGRPMDDKVEILKCNHCKRAVSKHAMPRHIEACLNKKQEKQRKKKEAKDARDAAARKEKAGDSDEEDDDGAKKTASKTGGLASSKKRKATDEGDDVAGGAGNKKKKKKDEPKAKAPRPKAPVDVEKQCGVELPQGGQCARSLTCKSHSMGAKRAVPGRSAPYDKLLMEYQRKNQAKLQKAAFDANAPNPDDDSLPSGPVDSEEEKDMVVAGIARAWGGHPIYQPVHVPLRKKYEYNRMKGMMQAALGSRASGGSIFGFGGLASGGSTGFFGPARVVEPDSDIIAHSRKASIIAGARSAMTAPSRKASTASAIGA